MVERMFSFKSMESDVCWSTCLFWGDKMMVFICFYRSNVCLEYFSEEIIVADRTRSFVGFQSRIPQSISGALGEVEETIQILVILRDSSLFPDNTFSDIENTPRFPKVSRCSFAFGAQRGGYDGQKNHNELYVFDLQSMEWRQPEAPR